MNPFNNPNQQQAMQFNPNFNNQNQNTHLANFNLPNPSNFQGIMNPNLQLQGAQNNQLGVLHLLAAQLQNNPQLQINLLNQLQTQSLAAPFNQMGMPFIGLNPIQNLSNLMGMSNGQFLAQNQLLGLLGNPQLGQNNMGLLGNPQSGQNNMGLLGNPQLGQNNMGLLGNPQLGQNNMGLGFGSVTMSSSPMKTQWNSQNVMQASGSRQVQVNHDDNSRVNSPNSASKFYGFGKERSHNRFQKSQSHGMRSSNGIVKKFNKGGGRGQHNWREQKSQPTNSGEEAPTVCRRPLPVNYTKTEIQLWHEARKKNFPTRANIDKKATDNKNAEDADAKLRRQQLKEVLLKQAELGVEVAEIPSSYLRDPQYQVPENENVRPAIRFNKKRGRGRGQDNWRSKRQKFKNKGRPTTSLPSVKKEPSLLEKLLSADIKRDKSRLLQVFRFMVLNDFFKQWPDKPLEFPMITVKDGVDSPVDEGIEKVMAEGIGNQNQKEYSEAQETENEFDEEGTVGISEAANLTEEQFEESEEGQITD